jgi:hypothetical protein
VGSRCGGVPGLKSSSAGSRHPPGTGSTLRSGGGILATSCSDHHTGAVPEPWNGFIGVT